MHKNPFIILLILSFSLILNIGNANAKQQPLRNINHQLAEDLGDHQSYADSDPGNYDYAKYIQRIYYLDRKTIIILNVLHYLHKLNYYYQVAENPY